MQGGFRGNRHYVLQQPPLFQALCLATSTRKNYAPPPSSVLSSGPLLVLRSCLLAGLELVEVPSADGQAALVLVHALAEVADICCADTGLL